MSLASSASKPSLKGQFVDADFDFSSLGAALWRARYRILRPTIVVALLTFGVVMMIPPKYQSEARVLVVGRDNVFLRPDADKNINDAGTVDPDTVTSQAQLMLSRDVASEVIAKLKLNELPEFDPAIGGISLIKRLMATVGLVKNPLNMTPEERVLDAYYERLTVFPVEKSHVIVIDFLSENPELAARVANTIADAYLKRQQEAKQDQARSASLWLSGEIETLRKKVNDAEAKVEAFRAGSSSLLIGPNNTTLSAQQLGDLNAQLATARAQKADAEAKARLIREMLKSGAPIESSDILNSELIRRLSEQRVTLRAQLAEQSSTLLGNHPRIKELRAQIDDLDRQLRKEAETIARSLENDSKLADARVAAQLASFDQIKSQAVTSNEDDVQLRALERDAKSQRDLLESYLAKYREATARDNIGSVPADARVISRATVSTVPAYPKKLSTVAIASLATLMLMAGLTITRELLDSSANPASRAAARPAAPARGRQEDTRAGADADTDAMADADMDVRAGANAGAKAGAKTGTKTGINAGAQFESSPRRFFGRSKPRDRVEPAGRIEDPKRAERAEPFERTERAKEQTSERNGERDASEASGALAARLRSIAAKEPPPIGVPVSAIDEFAHNLHAAGVEGSQIAFFSTVPQLDTGAAAVTFARALARDARVVLVALGAPDRAIRDISSDPGAPGLADLTSGLASFGDIITKDRTSSLNLIASGRGGSRAALLAAPGLLRTFAALAQAYPHVVIDAGALGGHDERRDPQRDLQLDLLHDLQGERDEAHGNARSASPADSHSDLKAVARIATHAMLLVEAMSADTAQARDRLLDAGFDNVTVVIAGWAGEMRRPIPAAAA
jgi:succinoglycan biosynthesis transport protein ExoP